ncbi:MAG TPA: type IV secretory system conjugative DNA transfer family protein, partial [Solirubrobacteraceae bacterium]|nr:type IV secretory system conjugative DNA transfer family protein [Solirubrobacteraceae bacterium]
MAEHQKPARLPIKPPDVTRQMAGRLSLYLALFTFLAMGTGETFFGLTLSGLAIACFCYAHPGLVSHYLGQLTTSTDKEPASPAISSLSDLQRQAARAGGGCYLGTTKQGRPIFAPATAAVLVLAGPRAGKTSCVVIPALAAHPGPAVATSTKREILDATLAVRKRLGQAWFFDLQGEGAPDGTTALRWSPVTRAADWQQAQLVAEAMTGASTVDADGAHWMERAGALIACCLHAAARSEQNMRQVLGWILRHDIDAPLEELGADSIAADVLQGIKHSSDRERASIYSTAARVLRAYRSDIALAASENPNFDPDTFVTARDTVYIAAPAHQQALLAPLVVGLLTDIRQAAYHRHQTHGPAPAPVLFLLDECANIAPLPDLPPMLSEGGGQGVQAVTVFQDMSQARRRWHADADGMLSLYGARAILSGIADTKTLEQLSLLCGDWDRPTQSITRQSPATLTSTSQASYTESWTTKRQRRLPPDEIAQIPQGQALIMVGHRWE